MYELVQVSEKCYYINCPAKIGVYVADRENTIDIEKVRNAYLSAKDNPAEENIFRQLRLNQWVKQSTRWMQINMKMETVKFPMNLREKGR